MTIEEMKARKAELGYTNEIISKLSEVPLGTVQKIFAGETKAPRYDTVQKLTKLLQRQDQNENETYEPDYAWGSSAVMETFSTVTYKHHSQTTKKKTHQIEDTYLKPPKRVIGIADGKYKMPPDDLFFDDEISEMFEDL